MYDLTTREGRNNFYNSKEWKEVRKYILDTDPLCRKCKAEGKLTAATDVDHIIDLVDDQTLQLDITNLQPLCKHHHSSKTMKKTNKGRTPPNKIDKTHITIIRKWKIQD